MKRIKIMGLCLVAAFSLAIVAASAASAAEPAFYECAKTAKGVGKYEKGCKKEAAAGKGTYEIKEGPGKGKLFKGKGGNAKLYTPAVEGEVNCTAFKDEGVVNTSTTENKVVSIFSGCTSLGKKCASAGQKAGTIKTNNLKGSLGYISKSEKKVGVDLSPETGTVLAEFECEGLKIVTSGSVIGQITPVNTFTKTTTTSFETEGSGASRTQKYKNLEGQPEDTLKSTINGSGPFPSAQFASAVNKGEELEIKA